MLAVSQLKNQRGMAVMELIPIALIIVLLLSFSFGFFGVIHTGILNSMAARNYAFETFNHRADLSYFRSTMKERLEEGQYHRLSYRVHVIASEKRSDGGEDSNKAIATSRDIAFGWQFGQPEKIAETSQQVHNKEIFSILDNGTRYEKDGVNPVWIQSSYGICLTMKCEP
jgi:hypothetical protein